MHKADSSSIFGEVPSSWKVDRIIDHITNISGGVWGDDVEAHDRGVVVPVVRVADFTGLDVAREPPTLRRITEDQLSSRRLLPNTVLIEKSGGGATTPVGRVVSCRALGCDSICSNFIARADCRVSLDAMFLVYVCRALYITRVNEACIQQTTGIQNLRLREFLTSKIPIPSALEQRAIVAFLDVRCAALGGAYGAPPDHSLPLDHTIGATATDLINAQSHFLEEYRDALIYECVTGKRRLTEADVKKVQVHG